MSNLGSSSYSGCWIRARLQARPSQCSAASTSSPLRPAVPHYFFSQIDDKLSRFTGRLAVSVHSTPPPRTQQEMHIVLKKCILPLRTFHGSFTSSPSRRSTRIRHASTRRTSRSATPPLSLGAHELRLSATTKLSSSPP